MTRVFGVSYQFLSCGSVFTDGIVNAAADLGIPYAHAAWDDPALSARIELFAPDLIFVVHGRRFAARFHNVKWFGSKTAVWLLDEPYEVDDTASWSRRFDQAFVCDASTLNRHDGSVYLPVCYDPHVHRPGVKLPHYVVGFIGGANPTRDRYLAALASCGLLSYVVGGPFGDPTVQALTVAHNIPPAATAAFYQATRIVVNVFRETHHYNREGIVATALNPRIYEALACGAIVVSEWRTDLDRLVPELPTFRSEAECVEIVTHLLAHPDEAEAIRLRCAARLASHTYAARLETVLTTMGQAVAA